MKENNHGLEGRKERDKCNYIVHSNNCTKIDFLFFFSLSHSSGGWLGNPRLRRWHMAVSILIYQDTGEGGMDSHEK